MAQELMKENGIQMHIHTQNTHTHGNSVVVKRGISSWWG